MVAVAAVAAWIVTRPAPLDPDFGTGLEADQAAGALVFAAAGCQSCHAAPGTEGDARLVLAGGQAFDSDFGTFHAPNISPDATQGIGDWSVADFARAVNHGVSPEGQHLYPAFPYTAYRHMTPQDVVNLHAYMMTLPASAEPSLPHDVAFPFNIRRAVGAWKLLYDRGDYVLDGDLDATLQRGRYLVEGVAHCGECHTPRTALGGLDRAAWLAGAPNPSGEGTIPNITPGGLDWSETDIAYYLETGFTPDYDSAGGEMAEVVENLSQLPAEDRAAIAAYLKAIPAITD